MKRIDWLQGLSVESMAHLIVHHGVTDAFCDNSCDDMTCPHPVECGRQWLETDEPMCRVCGCTDLHGCPEGCWWVEEDLCSSCTQPKEESE